MEPFLVEFKRKRADKLSYFSHDGEEFIYLLEGVLEFRTENQQYVLYPGDSLYFESSIPHAYRALEKKNARALTVVYPTRWEISGEEEEACLGGNKRWTMYDKQWTVHRLSSNVHRFNETGIIALTFRPKTFLRGEWWSKFDFMEEVGREPR